MELGQMVWGVDLARGRVQWRVLVLEMLNRRVLSAANLLDFSNQVHRVGTFLSSKYTE